MPIRVTEQLPQTEGVRSFLVEHTDEQLMACISAIERHNTSLHDETPKYEQLAGASILTNGQIADAFSHLVSALNHQRITRVLTLE